MLCSLHPSLHLSPSLSPSLISTILYDLQYLLRVVHFSQAQYNTLYHNSTLPAVNPRYNFLYHIIPYHTQRQKKQRICINQPVNYPTTPAPYRAESRVKQAIDQAGKQPNIHGELFYLTVVSTIKILLILTSLILPLILLRVGGKGPFTSHLGSPRLPTYHSLHLQIDTSPSIHPSNCRLIESTSSVFTQQLQQSHQMHQSIQSLLTYLLTYTLLPSLPPTRLPHFTSASLLFSSSNQFNSSSLPLPSKKRERQQKHNQRPEPEPDLGR